MSKGLENKERTCSICKQKFTGFGHNPEPVKPYPSRCCDSCNNGVVIPLRLFAIYHREAFAHFQGGKK